MCQAYLIEKEDLNFCVIEFCLNLHDEFAKTMEGLRKRRFAVFQGKCIGRRVYEASLFVRLLLGDKVRASRLCDVVRQTAPFNTKIWHQANMVKGQI